MAEMLQWLKLSPKANQTLATDNKKTKITFGNTTP